MGFVTIRSLILAAWCCTGAVSDTRWRDTLLAEAQKRILTWYPNPDVMQTGEVKEGVKVSMLKQDMNCGGAMVPVTFAEFDVADVAPVDLFNTMLDTPKQEEWNPQCWKAVSAGEFQQEGARAWAVTFALPLLSHREFVQWQVASADFAKQEFWLVFSTNNNTKLKEILPVDGDAVESQNCLGAYHITKTATGSHVIVTQQVNVHPFFAFPLHQILQWIPQAWQGTIDFVTQMSGQARKLGASGEAGSQTVAPAWMLTATSPQAAAQPQRLDEVFPELDLGLAKSRFSTLQGASLMLLVPMSFICVAFMVFRTVRLATRGVETVEEQEMSLVNTDTDLESESVDVVE